MTDTSQKAKSQLAAILAHLQAHGQIDLPTARTLFGCEALRSRIAWKEYGCAALRSRIADLRKQEIAIETRYVEFTSKFGHPGRYAVYHLEGFEKKLIQKSFLFQD